MHFQDAFLKIRRTEGIRTLWSGLGPTLVLALPTTVLYFVAYEQLRVHLKDYHRTNTAKNVSDDDYKLPMWIPLVSGCTARCFAVTVVNPLELIRTKMQSEKMSYLEVGRGFHAMIKQHGFRGFFKGLLPTILRDAPFSSIYWTSYELFKNYYNIAIPSFYQSFVGGAFAGSIAAFLTTPFDVIKTHQQIEFGEKVLYSHNGKMKKKPPSGTKATMRNIYKSAGIRGFFAGLAPRLFKVAPACAIMISSYEYGKSYFHEHNMRKYNEIEENKPKDKKLVFSENKNLN
jgi:solute carrier family 25 protein 39/40